MGIWIAENCQMQVSFCKQSNRQLALLIPQCAGILSSRGIVLINYERHMQPYKKPRSKRMIDLGFLFFCKEKKSKKHNLTQSLHIKDIYITSYKSHFNTPTPKVSN